MFRASKSKVKTVLFQVQDWNKYPQTIGSYPLQQTMIWTRFNLPPDGLPSRDDWLQCFESMIFSGINLNREPIDGCLPFPEGQGLTCGSNRYPNLFQNLSRGKGLLAVQSRYPNVFQNLSRGKGLLAVQVNPSLFSKTYQGARAYLQFK